MYIYQGNEHKSNIGIPINSDLLGKLHIKGEHIKVHVMLG